MADVSLLVRAHSIAFANTSTQWSLHRNCRAHPRCMAHIYVVATPFEILLFGNPVIPPKNKRLKIDVLDINAYADVTRVTPPRSAIQQSKNDNWRPNVPLLSHEPAIACPTASSYESLASVRRRKGQQISKFVMQRGRIGSLGPISSSANAVREIACRHPRRCKVESTACT